MVRHHYIGDFSSEQLLHDPLASPFKFLVVSAVYLIFCYYTVSQLLVSVEIMLLSILIVNLKSHARFFEHCKRIQAKQNACKSSLVLLSCFEICHSVFHIQLTGC